MTQVTWEALVTPIPWEPCITLSTSLIIMCVDVPVYVWLKELVLLWSICSKTEPQVPYLRIAVFGEHVQQCRFAALSVPDHHDLTATDLPLPLSLHQRTGESVPVRAARAQPQYRTPCAADGQTARRCGRNRGKKKYSVRLWSSKQSSAFWETER